MCAARCVLHPHVPAQIRHRELHEFEEAGGASNHFLAGGSRGLLPVVYNVYFTSRPTLARPSAACVWSPALLPMAALV